LFDIIFHSEYFSVLVIILLLYLMILASSQLNSDLFLMILWKIFLKMLYWVNNNVQFLDLF